MLNSEGSVVQITLDEVLGSRIYSIEEIMVTVSVAQIDPKQASEILQEFATLLPLQAYNLDHMKRVRRNLSDRSILEILICPERCINDVPSFLIEKCVLNTIRTTVVPKLKPMTRAEYEEWGRDWPTMFRPNAVDKDREKGFSKLEMAQHSYFMSLVDKDAEDVRRQNADRIRTSEHLKFNNFNCNLNGGGIIVNPQNGRVSPFINYLPAYLFIIYYPFIHYLFTYLFIYVSLFYLHTRVSSQLRLSLIICLRVHVSICLSIYLSTCLFNRFRLPSISREVDTLCILKVYVNFHDNCSIGCDDVT